MELRSSWNRGLLLFCFFQQHCGLFRCIVWFWVDCPFKHSTVVISLKLGRKCRCDISLGYREETVSTLDLSFKGSARLTKVLRPFENAFPWLRQEKHTLTLKQAHQQNDTASGSGQHCVYYSHIRTHLFRALPALPTNYRYCDEGCL